MAENVEVDKEIKEAPPGRVSVGDSVRAAIAKAEATPKPEAPAKETEPAKDDDKPRTPDGKFAAKEPSGEATAAPAAPEKPGEGVDAPKEPEAQPKPSIRAPQSLTTDRKAAWDKLPPEWQTEIDRLERAAKTKIEQTGAMANFGQAIISEVQPYEAMIRAEGGTPQTAIRDLLRTAYLLRTAPPTQKQALWLQVAQQYGIDVSGILQGQLPQVDPHVMALHRQVEQMQRERQQEMQQRTNAEQAQVSGTIEAFAADPKHEHFEDVRVQMGMLIESGAARTLDEAYEHACWANPTIRAKLIQSQHEEAEAKRKADERKAVEAKKAAGGSIRGAPAAPIAAAPGKKETVGETIRRVTAQAQGHI